MRQTNFKIGQAAESLGVTTATVRNWLAEFGDHFSENALRKQGKQITYEDMRVLLLM